jgi:superoxide dismutase, Cu-Zn family
MKRHLSTSLALLLSACGMHGTDPGPTASAAAPARATETLRDASGRPVGTATLTQVGDSIQIRIESTGLPRGPHGAHVHAVGQCTAPTFESAGPHWNPTGRQHGKNNPAGMHKGDLPNLLIDATGRGTLEYTVAAGNMIGGAAPLLDADGAAIVVHASADDYRTDPTGNSGGRIACAAFR